MPCICDLALPPLFLISVLAVCVWVLGVDFGFTFSSSYGRRLDDFTSTSASLGSASVGLGRLNNQRWAGVSHGMRHKHPHTACNTSSILLRSSLSLCLKSLTSLSSCRNSQEATEKKEQESVAAPASSTSTSSTSSSGTTNAGDAEGKQRRK